MSEKYLNIAIVLFFSYLTIVVLCFRWLPSISQSFYEFKKYKLGFVFTLFMFSLSMLIIFAASKPIMTIAGLMIILVGAFPYFDKKGMAAKHNQSSIHYMLALGGMLLGMVSLVVEFKQWEVVAICAALCLFLKLLKVNNLFYWIEFIVMNAIFIGLKL